MDLIPSTGIADGDLVSYDVNFSPDSSCDPLYADPILEAANVRSDLNQEYATTMQQGKERGGWIYQNNSTGEYITQPEMDPSTWRDACEIDAVPVPPTVPGYTPVGSYHDHVLDAGDVAPSGCRNVPAGTPFVNGPSNADRQWTGATGLPDYMMDADELFTIDRLGNVAPQDWTRDNFCRS